MHSYNVKSGSGIITGAHTVKLLHVGIRNKYRSVCAHSAKHNSEWKHDRYKTWDDPSSSMETDIVVQGFREAEAKYGLRYTTFTGEGQQSELSKYNTESDAKWTTELLQQNLHNDPRPLL